MKRTLVLLFIGAVAAVGFSQSMMKTAGSSGGTGSMTSPNTLDAAPTAGSELRTAKSEAKKIPFTNLADAQALAEKVPVVLFFAADWCPTCQSAMKDINANGSRLGAITIVVVDYDKEKDLKRQFGVTVQHTFVQIDAKGRKLGAWNGGGVDLILERVVRT